MERYRLKNIIILILVLVNVFLLASLAFRKTAEHSAQRQATEQLVALFAADEIALSSEIISHQSPPSPCTLTRNTELDREVALFLLGSGVSYSDQGGGIYTYTSPSGSALFRANGSFDAAGTLTAEHVTDFCRNFCQEFSYSTPSFQLDENGSGTAVAYFQYNDLPVFNCAVTFTIDHGKLLTVSGTLLPTSGSAVSSSQSPLSSSAALTAFLQMRRETAAAVSSVTDIYLCYELQSTASASMTLSPSWCIVTDTAKYYVNSITGLVSTI